MFSFLVFCTIGAQQDGSGPNWTDHKEFSRERQEKALGATLRLLNPTVNNNQGTAVRIKRLASGRVYYLTAAHVLGSSKTVNLEGFKASSYPKVEVELKAVDVIQRWDNENGLNKRLHNVDLALLEGVENEQNQSLNIVPEDKIPKSLPFSAITLGCSGGDPPTFVLDRVVGRGVFVRPGGNRGHFWQTEKQPVVGRSGGPLIDASGYLVGICSGTAGNAGGQFGYYVDAEIIREAVARRAKILLEPDGPSGKDR